MIEEDLLKKFDELIALLKRSNRYDIFEIPLTVVHENSPIGIGAIIKSNPIPYCTYMCILDAPAPWQFRVNRSSAPLCDAVVGDRWENFEITEVYITNPIGAGIGKLYVEWREEPLRGMA